MCNVMFVRFPRLNCVVISTFPSAAWWFILALRHCLSGRVEVKKMTHEALCLLCTNVFLPLELRRSRKPEDSSEMENTPRRDHSSSISPPHMPVAHVTAHQIWCLSVKCYTITTNMEPFICIFLSECLKSNYLELFVRSFIH